MGTLQTDAPIARLGLATYNRPMMHFIMGAASGDVFDFDPPYQRGLVWSVTRKRKLIRSLLEGVPIPSVIVNDRLSGEFNDPACTGKPWAYAIIDGKQRISAIVGFACDEYAVPASWFKADRIETTVETEDGPYVHWSGMTLPGQRFFSNMTIGVAEGRFKTLAEEAEIFDRVNFGGVAQGDSDL